jgi:hypothetical protein
MLVIQSAAGGSYTTYADGTGVAYETGWVTIDNPDPAAGELSTVRQGIAKGGAQFRRLEGAWWGNDRCYVVSTSGGPKGQGQVFEYDPAGERMRVLFASPDASVLNNPDNISVSPRGGIMLCEDGSDSEYLHGLTTDGEIFPFALNQVVIPAGGVPGKKVAPGNYTGSEWCGSTFEPKNGNWLFANAQTPGITFAITGPWALTQADNGFQATGVPYAVSPIPAREGGPDPAVFVGVQGFMISSFSEQKDLATSFVLDFMSQETTQLALFEAGGRPPALTSAFEQVRDDPDIAGFGESGAAGIPLPAIPEMSNVWTSLGLAEVNVLRGSNPAQEFRAAAEAIRGEIGG